MSDFVTVCEKAARAGAAAVQQWVGRLNVREKGRADLVTEADFASQEAVRKAIAEVYPDHDLIGEEGPPASDAAERAEYRWIVDPLDGTTNFVHGVPHYAVSLALERRGKLLAAAVFDPVNDECFTAAAGGGAMLNGRPIHTSNVDRLGDALAAVGFPPSVDRDSPDLIVFLAAIGRCQAIRRTGSAALNLCYLAAGRFDVFWSYATRIWDVAAGILVVQEAGGALSAFDGGPFDLEEARFLAAANRPLHEQLRELVAGCWPPK
jgi:myo-inositol-1(or 4)-monophosphatase